MVALHLEGGHAVAERLAGAGVPVVDQPPETGQAGPAQQTVDMAIVATHALIYSDDAPATRAFLRDVLQWPAVGSQGPTDSPDEQDWLVFATGQGELGVHPTRVGEGERAFETPAHHEVSLVCDDLEATMAELAGRGARFTGEPQDRGFGVAVGVAVPGSVDILLYQPHHPTAFDLA